MDDYEDGRRKRRRAEADYPQSPSSAGKKANTSINEAGLDQDAGGKVKVPVHEDFLFDVDVEMRELSPVYWLGPIYQVLRGSWFYQEGSTLRPCDENLAAQLEEGYLKVKPFRYPKAPPKPAPNRSTTLKPGEKPESLKLSGAFGGRNRGASGSSNEVTPHGSMEDLRAASQQADDGSRDSPLPSPHQPQTHRLFGTHMNSIVTYQDENVAWISNNDIYSRVSSTVYQKFAGGGYLGGVKIVRGYSEPGKPKDSNADRPPRTPTSAAAMSTGDSPISLQLDERQQNIIKRRSAPPSTSSPENRKVEPLSNTEAKEAQLNKALNGAIDTEAEAEAVRKRDEKEIQNDYNDLDGENQGRDIEHLLLVTHGIGQRLGMRYVQLFSSTSLSTTGHLWKLTKWDPLILGMFSSQLCCLVF